MSTFPSGPADAPRPRPRRNTGPACNNSIHNDGSATASNEVPVRLVRRYRNGPPDAGEVAGRTAASVEAAHAAPTSPLTVPETGAELIEPTNGRSVVQDPSGARPPRPMPGRLIDGLASWDAETAGNPVTTLTQVRIDQSENFVVPFTLMMLPVVAHYLKFNSLKGYVLCNAPQRCLLCEIGCKPEDRKLWPVYDITNRAVAILPISLSIRPQALWPQLVPALRRLAAADGPLLITLRKRNDTDFVVTTQPLAPGAEDGAHVIKAFVERFEAGQVDLATAFQQLSNEELATIDEIKVIMKARGIDL